MKNVKNSVRLWSLVVLLSMVAAAVSAQSVRITLKPEGLVHGDLMVPISTSEPVTRVELLVNGVKLSEGTGRSMVIPVKLGDYVRRIRIRAIGYDATQKVVGEDQMVVNDPKPPFRVRLHSSGSSLEASIVKPPELTITSADFYIGEEKISTVSAAPWVATWDAARVSKPLYARVAVHAADGQEANDVFFFGSQPSGEIEVTLQQLPLSLAGAGAAPKIADLALTDNGAPRKIEALVPASDQPLNLILLIDYSESMFDELPVVKAAAKQFAQTLLRPNDRIAVVGFNQTLFWLSPFTNDFEAAAASVDRVKPAGETHLYDSAIEMLYELQKQPGRHALILLTDGVDQGSKFKLDHLIHYARYAGVPVYPVIKNTILTRLMRFGIGYLESRRLAGLARDTGATYFIIRKESELAAVYAAIAQELRQQYQLVFHSDASAADEWHSLAITSRAGQPLRIPKGYFP
ncbi:MAG: VWA domain-containing protein [Thermoanaerobaculia bacterium]